MYACVRVCSSVNDGACVSPLLHSLHTCPSLSIGAIVFAPHSETALEEKVSKADSSLCGRCSYMQSLPQPSSVTCSGC